jgi:sugar transferase EpsL
MKKAFDLLLSLVLTVVFAVPMAIVASAILFSMGRPVFFRQVRPGYRGRPFTILKFRTMNDARDAAGGLLPDEQRLTRTGSVLRKFSLDELPQLFNVLKGDLSFVGPRPLLMQYIPLYDEHQARRHEAKPGITGWAQVNGRNAITWEEKFDLDVWYVDHMSFGLDMKILGLTAAKVLKREGIAAEGCGTMPEFKGSAMRKEHTDE